MTDLREARLVDLLPKAVADRQEVKALSDAWHDLAVMTLDFSDRAKTYTGHRPSAGSSAGYSGCAVQSGLV